MAVVIPPTRIRKPSRWFALKVVFIGPCAAKKLEASRQEIRSDIDFVLTFEEVVGMFTAKGIDFEQIPADGTLSDASADGRGFAVSQGVASAVVNCIKELEPGREMKVANAEGLRNCRELLEEARKGKYDGFLLEGMACPGGCVGGAGTMQGPTKAKGQIVVAKKKSLKKNALESSYKDRLDLLAERGKLR